MSHVNFKSRMAENGINTKDPGLFTLIMDRQYQLVLNIMKAFERLCRHDDRWKLKQWSAIKSQNLALTQVRERFKTGPRLLSIETELFEVFMTTW